MAHSTNDGVLRLLTGLNCQPEWLDCTNHTRKCSPAWTDSATILAIPGQKYTIGSGKHYTTVYKEVEHGQFLLFRDTADISAIQCQIWCDSQNTFWLHSLGYGETFLEGKLVTAPARLRFGSIFYFSHTLSPIWDPHLCPHNAHKLHRPNSGGKLAAVFKFDRLIPKGKTRHKNKTKVQPPVPAAASSGKGNKDKFLKSSPSIQATQQSQQPWSQNGVILSKIFSHLASKSSQDPSSSYQDLLHCRLVSKSWKAAANHTLKSSFPARLTIVLDEVVQNPNKMAERLHYFNHRISKELPFENWKFDIWPIRYGIPTLRDNPERDLALHKFSQEFAPFLAQDFAIKRLDLNVDYLLPISQILRKCCHSLEELTIQINPLWMKDETLVEFSPEVTFPSLTTLRIQFSCGEDEQEDLDLVKDSPWLRPFLAACSNIRVLILKNYAKLPVQFQDWRRLERIKVRGRWEYGVYELHLQQCLEQLANLPRDQVKAFKLDASLDGQITGRVDEALPNFLERQKRSLKRLELSVPQDLGIILPRELPSLRRLWINCDVSEEEDEGFGVRLQEGSGSSRMATGPRDIHGIRRLPLVSLTKGGAEGVVEENAISLEFGRWNNSTKEFMVLVPNVEKMWAWS